MPLWGRDGADALSDTVEWREWFEILAARSLSRQEAGESATTGSEKAMGGDPREVGTVQYWRWKGQHVVRYATWPAGADYDGSTPALLLLATSRVS